MIHKIAAYHVDSDKQKTAEKELSLVRIAGRKKVFSVSFLGLKALSDVLISASIQQLWNLSVYLPQFILHTELNQM